LNKVEIFEILKKKMKIIKKFLFDKNLKKKNLSSGFHIGGEGIWNFTKVKPLWRIIISSPKKMNAGLFVFGVSSAAFYYTHLQHIPISNRNTFVTVPAVAEERLSNVMWVSFKHQYQDYIVSEDDKNYIAVKRVINRIIDCSDCLELKRYNWEIILVDQPIVNAFALPAGKIIVCDLIEYFKI
jgi:hypothetical protein